MLARSVPQLVVRGSRGLATVPTMPATNLTMDRPYNGPSYESCQATRAAHLNNLLTYYREPVLVHQGKMQYLFDHQGKRYLDAFAGIVTVSIGHCHPVLTERLVEQVETLQHATNIYMHPRIHEFAEALTAKLPDGLDTVFFTNSGSEANDFAMLLARAYTGNYEVVSTQNGYHGMVGPTMGLTASGQGWARGPGVDFGVKHTMTADPYLGPFGGTRFGKTVSSTGACDPADAGKLYAKELHRVIDYTTRGSVAAFFAEPIQGVGGTMAHADGYLAEAHRIVKKAGGLYVSDEVQCGFGRLGTDFWGFEAQLEQGQVPDIVTMAKGIGNGLPLGAVVTTKEIAASLGPKITFNTYGGNPLSCVAGKAVLDVIEEEGMQQNSLELGNYMLGEFDRLAEKHSIIGDPRGKGLMLGVELVTDRETKAPATAECVEVFETCKELGMLIGKGGRNGNCLRIKPPMCWNKDDAKFCIDVLDEAFNRL